MRLINLLILFYNIQNKAIFLDILPTQGYFKYGLFVNKIKKFFFRLINFE
ncbi:hypothetical protein ES703_17126 [subsurface metagenome]